MRTDSRSFFGERASGLANPPEQMFSQRVASVVIESVASGVLVSPIVKRESVLPRRNLDTMAQTASLEVLRGNLRVGCSFPQ